MVLWINYEPNILYLKIIFVYKSIIKLNIMARDCDNYPTKGIVKNKTKARLVQKTIENYINKSNMGFSVLKKVWFDDLQGGKGVIKKLTDIDKKNEQNYYIENPIILRDGTEIAICNQWEDKNLSNFIFHAKSLGFEIKPETSK